MIWTKNLVAFCVVDDDDDVVVSGSRATETRCKRGDECATLLLLFGRGGGEEAGMFVRSSSPFAFYYECVLNSLKFWCSVFSMVLRGRTSLNIRFTQHHHSTLSHGCELCYTITTTALYDYYFSKKYVYLFYPTPTTSRSTSRRKRPPGCRRCPSCAFSSCRLFVFATVSSCARRLRRSTWREHFCASRRRFLER